MSEDLRMRLGQLVVLPPWTMNLPTVPGFYWYRDALRQPRVAEVIISGTGEIASPSVPIMAGLGAWYGPLLPPRETPSCPPETI